jgi:hypothetical protein
MDMYRRISIDSYLLAFSHWFAIQRLICADSRSHFDRSSSIECSGSFIAVILVASSITLTYTAKTTGVRLIGLKVLQK